MKVSAVIPCYNAGNLLSAMIDCFLRQTLKEWELIIVDDGSTDNSLNILKEYSKRDERIKVFSRDREPKGPQVCRNTGLSKVTGKYVVIFDADDLISDTCLENRVAFMDANPDIDYASFPAKHFYEENNLPIYNENTNMFGVVKNPNNIDLLSKLLTTAYPFTVWTNIYRKKSIENIRYIEIFGGYEDFDFMTSCVFKGLKHKYSGIKELDYYYRVVKGNMTSKLGTDYSDATIYLFSEKLEILKTRSDYKKRKQEFTGFIILHFVRIIENGNRENTAIYIEFCKKYYGKLFACRLKIISKIALFFKNTVRRKLILYFLTAVLFRHCGRMFIRTLKKWE